jgi:hypothetical protein
MLFLGLRTAISQPGSSGFPMLKVGLSPRSIGMGDATTALLSGAGATQQNPAGILPGAQGSRDADIMFTHRSWIQDVRTEFLGSAIPLSSEEAVAGFVSTTTISGIEARLTPGPADDTFSSREFIAGIAYAHTLSTDIRIAIAAKYLYQRIYVSDASGVAFDLGCLWDTPLRGLHVGGSIMNIGRMSPLVYERTKLPALIRLGGAYGDNEESSSMQFSVAADLVRNVAEGLTYANAGGEYGFQSIFFVRGGYQFGSDTRGLCAGVGLRVGRLQIDYAYSHVALDLGNGSTISLALRL